MTTVKNGLQEMNFLANSLALASLGQFNDKFPTVTSSSAYKSTLKIKFNYTKLYTILKTKINQYLINYQLK